MLYTILLILIPEALTYNDYMTHTALSKVPAIIGQDAEMRCTKIIEKSQSDYIETSHCSPEYGESCYHAWTKDGVNLTAQGSKYNVATKITYDYCENFNWTSDLLSNFSFLQNIKNNEQYVSREMKCYASILTIKNVQNSDLGEYSCNFTDHLKGSSSSTEDEKYNHIQNITLFDANSDETQPAKVEYYESFYTKGMYNKLLLQCVVTGAPIYWLALTGDRCWDNWDECAETREISNFDGIDTDDYWRCYNYTIVSHSPHPNITESFIYIENICAQDWGYVKCSADPAGKITSLGLVKPTSYNHRYGTRSIQVRPEDCYYCWWPNAGNYTSAFSAFVIPIMVLLIVLGVVFASVRGGACSCAQRPQFIYSMPSTVVQPTESVTMLNT